MTDLLKDFETWFREMRRLVQVALGRFSREGERAIYGYGFDFLPGGIAGLDQIVERGCGIYRSASEEDRELMRSLFSLEHLPLTRFLVKYADNLEEVLSQTHARDDLERALTIIAMLTDEVEPGDVPLYALPLYHAARKAGVPDLDACFRRAGELSSKTPPGRLSPCGSLARIPTESRSWSLMLEEREKASKASPKKCPNP